MSADLQPGIDWFATRHWQPFPFQLTAWRAYLDGQDGLVNAATGSGKTYALIVPILLAYQAEQAGGGAQVQGKDGKKPGLRALWISPIRALTREIRDATQQAAAGLGLDWRSEIRTGDTSAYQRSKQLRQPPQLLITTPESLQLLLANNDYRDFFAQLDVLVADEWHELLGSKRGVQLELALSRLRTLRPSLRTWGISATIGNLDEAARVLFGTTRAATGDWSLVLSQQKKSYTIKTILPPDINQFPWAGRLGIVLVKEVLDIVQAHATTLVFTNTRAQCELWYQALLAADPELAGMLGMHHSAIERSQREWVEEALHDTRLKAVICTSSLDLGVDFRPVEAIVQVGSPMGVARFLQRAGRSGHQPGATSLIHLVPTHALELIDAAALQAAIKKGHLEARVPYRKPFDVLVQYLVTLSISGGFYPDALLAEVRQTHAFAQLGEEEWQWCLAFIRDGGPSLSAYPEHQRVGVTKDGRYVIQNQRLATRHKMSIGTIVSDGSLLVKYRSGKKIGHISERFVSSLKKGDVFTFSGKVLEFVRLDGMAVCVKASKRKRARTPAWSGSRLPLSAELADEIRAQLGLIHAGTYASPELQSLRPLLELQQQRSHIPAAEELLVEYYHDREGYHLLVYPFAGRFIHEGISTLMAWRISQQQPISFSIAVNDYGFELVSDQEIDVAALLTPKLFSTDNLREDLRQSANATNMAKRRFREIAVIAGLVFTGFPAARKKDRHLQSSSQLFFEVYTDHEPDNLLLQQAHTEVLERQLDEKYLRATLRRIATQKMVICRPERFTVLAFPLIVARLRERISSETLADRIAKMRLQLTR